ncbi:hypothetical protein K466DRAFT_545150 [Polyporus arcularius HHB13444]|uniref:MYND-type domain-containing protein n=1 Tax=Polyporus arcularius HHB13444 TaxID=1314778 RepID=A0A5C3PI74_9APHY|nr:hypothetical protein K466DRAFT_545150 [Polyporus arcularius HHB13444]
MTKVIHEVIFDIPPEYYGAYPNLDDLVILKEELTYDHRSRSNPSCRRLYQETIRWIEEYPYERLKRGVDLKDAPLMLEYCLRQLTQCAVPSRPDYQKVLEMLESLTGNRSMSSIVRAGGKVPHINKNTPLIRRCAHAACAWMFFSSHFKLPTGGSMHAIETNPLMHNAAFNANLCARDDWQPRIVIRIANWLASLRHRYPGTRNRVTRTIWDMKHLWSAYEDYTKRRIAAQIKEYYEVNTAKNVYICGAENCDVQAVHKNAFRACSGNCPPETKPHYCSKLCQQKHWFVHRYVCKKGIPADPVGVDDGDPDWVDANEHYNTAYPEDVVLSASQVWSSRPGADICIDVQNPSPYRPLDMFRIRTRTLSPAFLRYFRLHWDLQANNLYADDVTSNGDSEREVGTKRTPIVKPRAARVGQTKARMDRMRMS